MRQAYHAASHPCKRRLTVVVIGYPAMAFAVSKRPVLLQGRWFAVLNNHQLLVLTNNANECQLQS